MPKRKAMLSWGDREAFFFGRLEIGRGRGAGQEDGGRLELADPTISSRHCVLTQDRKGRFLVRDLSRNGTRVDGRRLVPNVEFEIHPGQTLTVGPFELVLSAGSEPALTDSAISDSPDATLLIEDSALVTLLVGDIRGYTALNQKEDPARIAPAVRRVFSELEELIVEHGGSLKEYHGDAVLAFWEAAPTRSGAHAVQAAKAALSLHRRACDLAAMEDVWPFPEFPLVVDFALATGKVIFSAFGKDRPTGLSMIGDVVNVAFRIEKLASDETGAIIACQTTQGLARDRFDFADLGEFEVAGRRGRERIYALRGLRPEG